MGDNYGKSNTDLILYLYSILTYAGKVLSGVFGNRETVRILYVEISVNFNFDLRIFSLRTVLIKLIMCVNRWMDVLNSVF
jgi:hypothetical protein